MITCETAAKKTWFEYIGTLNLFSLKIKFYNRKVEKIHGLYELKGACDRIEAQLDISRHFEEQKLLGSLR